MNTVGYSQQGTGGYLDSLNGMTTAIGILNAKTEEELNDRLEKEQTIIKARMEGIKTLKDAELAASMLKFAQDTNAIKKRIALEQNKIKADTKLDEKTRKKKLNDLKKQQDKEINDYKKQLSIKEKLALASAERIAKRTQFKNNLLGEHTVGSKEGFGATLNLGTLANKLGSVLSVSGFANYAASLKSDINSIAEKKGAIDTRLNGTNLK